MVWNKEDNTSGAREVRRSKNKKLFDTPHPGVFRKSCNDWTYVAKSEEEWRKSAETETSQGIPG
jgi:hypothetical protein